MKTVRLGLIGFGNVGRGLAQALLENDSFYKESYGLDLRICAVNTRSLGTLYAPQGLPLKALLENTEELKNFRRPEWDALSMIREAELDCVAELSFTDLVSGEPAVTHCREAFLSGKSVVTCNKGPAALRCAELNALAAEKGLSFGIEGTVMSGSPAIRLGTDILSSTVLRGVRGILNGTTNYILCAMEEGRSYDEALKQAQEAGYAEADPSGDVEGYDTAGKVAILAQVLFGADIRPSEIERQGITKLTSEDIRSAVEQGKRWKLLGSVEKTADGVRCRVRPELVSADDPLSNVRGAGNAIEYDSALLGKVLLIGAGAGRVETAAAVLEDVVRIYG